jgi:small-conductance mechanosensitive channel
LLVYAKGALKHKKSSIMLVRERKLSWIVFGIDLIQVAKVILILSITYILGKLVSKSLFKLFEKTPFPENIEKAIVKISKYTIYIVGTLFVIAFLGFDLTSLILGLGAFSIAITFATSTIIQNMISGLLVQADRAFKVGDTILIQGIEGKVIKIKVRTTILETREGHCAYVPNSLFMTNVVTRKNRKETKT